MASELALRTVKTVDDEGYYDRPAASEAVDLYILAPIREALEGLRRSWGCWCNSRGWSMIDSDHTEDCQRAREVYESLRVR